MLYRGDKLSSIPGRRQNAEGELGRKNLITDVGEGNSGYGFFGRIRKRDGPGAGGVPAVDAGAVFTKFTCAVSELPSPTGGNEESVVEAVTGGVPPENRRRTK